MRYRKTLHREPAPQPALAVDSVQTTLRLPALLYERAKTHVRSGQSRSVNELVSRAVQAYLQAMERRAVDDAFRPMAEDSEYQQEALLLAGEFAYSDAEALQVASRPVEVRRAKRGNRHGAK